MPGASVDELFGRWLRLRVVDPQWLPDLAMEAFIPTELSIGKVGLVLGLSFFLGLAFEGFYWKSRASRPGGIRTFPLLALAGLLLYALEPQHLAAFVAGLLLLGIWLYPYYRAEVEAGEALPGERPRGTSRNARDGTTDEANEGITDGIADGIMVPVCNLIAYLLGAVALSQPAWVAIALTVLTVLLLRAREKLHAWARRVPGAEILTLVQFLILSGVVLPLLPRSPITDLTALTPFQVWLAVIAVCSISYASYLLQRYISPAGSVFFASVLGGMYSSTATTVVLARRMAGTSASGGQVQSGIVLATTVMYARIGVIVAIFNVPLALALAPWLAALALLGVAIAVVLLRWHAPSAAVPQGQAITPPNPLELGAALLFAILFVVISLLTGWIKAHLGSTGVYALAAVVGVTDIDPFVLSLAHGGVKDLNLTTMRTAILIAASSNNVLKAIYTISFGGWRPGRRPFVGLVVLAAAGLAIAFVLA
ncbi:MAG: DUF4010 domain-containing protein [Phycisphaerales bacterium]|nr:DUF4010 domain-containing protein [Phycisphaerales bacterium]